MTVRWQTEVNLEGDARSQYLAAADLCTALEGTSVVVRIGAEPDYWALDVLERLAEERHLQLVLTGPPEAIRTWWLALACRKDGQS